MQRFKEFFKTQIWNKIKVVFNKSKGLEGTAKHSLEKLSSLIKKRSSTGKSLSDLKWDQIFSTIFSPQSRKRIHQGFMVALIASATYGTGKTIALLASSQDAKVKSTARNSNHNIPNRNLFNQEIAQIKKSNLFNARESDSDKIARLTKKKVTIDESDQCKQSRIKSSLPIKLINTIVLQDSVKSIASVQVRSAKELITVRQGDKIKQMAKISLINRRRVILKNLTSGACEHIENFDKEKRSPLTVVSPREGQKLINSIQTDGIQSEGNSFRIKKGFRDKMLSDISTILSDARAIRIENPDGTLSFKMIDVKAGSLYTMLNIQNDDIISSIDGKKIRNVNELMGMFGRIKEIDHLEIGVQRQGSEEKREYSFVD